MSRGGRPLEIGGQKQRAVLAILALNAGRVVSTDRLVDLLWGEQPPKTAVTSLQNFISQLRKTVGADVVVTKAPGYLLNVAAAQVDLNQFERLVAEARSLEPEARGKQLREALALWRGPPLADFTFEPFAETEIARLEELRSAALEDRIEADLEGGGAAELVGELEGLVKQNPLRERLRGQLMLALYRSGRQAEALRAYQEARRVLVDELGIEPSPALQQLHASILRQESALQPQAGAPAAEDRVGEVVRALLSGRLVPVLGPGSTSEEGQDLGSRLAESFDCPEEHRGDLTRVSQYVAVTQGVGPLYDQLHELFAEDSKPGPVERFLAGLPELARARGTAHQLIVTTGYDHALERAFEERGEEADIVSFVAMGPDRGKFVHRSPDGSETVIAVPNTYGELSLSERPVILKLHGGVDRRPERGRESFVVSEDDYIGYLAQSELANVLPVTVVAKLRRSHLLFIAYPVVEWSLRVFLHRVFGDQPISYRSWAVLPGAQPIQHELWRQRGVDLYDVPLDEFVADLERRLGCGGDRVIIDSPYKGLVPFKDTELDALLFYGRERESEIIAANVLASRLTVLYGPSGVGKSSVLRAGVAHRLRRQARENVEEGGHPEFAVVVFDAWSDDPIGSLRSAVRDELAAQFGSALLDEGENESLADTLGRWTESLACDLLLVLDQAEEYFLYHAEETGFARELPELVTRDGLRVRVLLALRDDALAKLDRFKGRIPSLFANYLRLDHLDRSSARDAITKPVERYNEATGQSIEVEPALIEAVLDQTAAGKVDLGDAGRGLAAGESEEGRIEAPYLQLVLERVWEEEREVGSSHLRAATLDRLGGAEAIVRTHLHRAVEALSSDEKDLAADMFRHLVTPSGTKIAHGVGDLAEYASADEERLLPVLATLGRERIVRPVDGADGGGARYEIFHDVLGDAVLAWRRERELERERRTAERRQRRLALFAGARSSRWQR